MAVFPRGTQTPFGRAISAEIRAIMAARRVTGRELALAAGFSSHNYLAIRLRDEKPFTLDDLERICHWLEEDEHAFVKRACDNHYERIWAEMPGTFLTRQDDEPVAAHDEEHAIEAEQVDDTP